MFTSLCPDPVLPGHGAGDVPFLLQTLWPQPAGPVGSLIPRQLLQPNEGACKELMNFVYGRANCPNTDPPSTGEENAMKTKHTRQESGYPYCLAFICFPLCIEPHTLHLCVFNTHTFLWE